MAKSTRKSEFYPFMVLSNEPWWEMEVMPNVNYALPGKNKDQPRDFYNYLNQKVITAISTLDGSTLGDNLNTSLQVDYMSSALIPAVKLLK